MLHKIQIPDGFMFTKRADGALANYTEVEKINSEIGDAHFDGTKGIIIGSVGNGKPLRAPGMKRDVTYMYFVIWYIDLHTPVATVDYKLKVIE